jgi:FixJ family two-component response regulator
MPELPEFSTVIAIVDDDPSVRRGLERLIQSVWRKAEIFAFAQEFLSRPRTEEPSCVVLDLQLPGLSGLDLPKQMGQGLVYLNNARFAALSGEYDGQVHCIIGNKAVV